MGKFFSDTEAAVTSWSRLEEWVMLISAYGQRASTPYADAEAQNASYGRIAEKG
jgi:hypothetical protein